MQIKKITHTHTHIDATSVRRPVRVLLVPTALISLKATSVGYVLLATPEDHCEAMISLMQGPQYR